MSNERLEDIFECFKPLSRTFGLLISVTSVDSVVAFSSLLAGIAPKQEACFLREGMQSVGICVDFGSKPVSHFLGVTSV